MTKARAAGAALAALLLACSARAAEPSVPAVVVIGTLASVGAAIAGGASWRDCAPQGWRARGFAGRDAELATRQLGAAASPCRLRDFDGLTLEWSPTFIASDWHAGSGAGVRHAWDVAAVPMLRWRRSLGAQVALELEFGIGIAWLSEPDVGARRKSTHAQFSDHVGVGLADAAGRWRLGWGVRHVSNADMRTPNNAVDFRGVFFEWRPD